MIALEFLELSLLFGIGRNLKTDPLGQMLFLSRKYFFLGSAFKLTSTRQSPHTCIQ
jgi:hypothetical protein